MITNATADGVPDGWFAYGGSSGYAHRWRGERLRQGVIRRTLRKRLHGTPRELPVGGHRWRVLQELTITVVATGVNVDLIAEAGTGVVSFGQITGINLTANALLTL